MLCPPSSRIAFAKILDLHAIGNILKFLNLKLKDPKPKTYKQALEHSCWIEAMQEEIHEFERLDVWILVPCPDNILIIPLKWIFKIKLDEYGDVLKKTHMLGLECDQDSSLLKRQVWNNGNLPGWKWKTAFLNGEMNRSWSMLVKPEGFVDQSNHRMCTASRSSLGLKQAPRAWFYDKYQFYNKSKGRTVADSIAERLTCTNRLQSRQIAVSLLSGILLNDKESFGHVRESDLLNAGGKRCFLPPGVFVYELLMPGLRELRPLVMVGFP
ncbi:hypothetical protein Tco_0269616 [Tanacetum coccineum]